MTPEQWKESWRLLWDLVDNQVQSAQKPALMFAYVEGGSMRKMLERNFDLLNELVDCGMVGQDRLTWLANIEAVRELEIGRLPTLAGDRRPTVPMGATIH